MKKIKYLLIILGLASFLSVQAQGIAQMPTTPFRSTSTMVGSGSTLPAAANTGVRVTGATVGTYADASYASRSSRPRRGSIGDGGGFADGDDTPGQGDNNPPELPGDLVPIGDAVLPLMLMAMLFAGGVYWRRRRVVANVRQE